MTRFANYKGYVDPVGQIVGPSLNGKDFWVATSAVFDPESKMTQVSFEPYEG